MTRNRWFESTSLQRRVVQTIGSAASCWRVGGNLIARHRAHGRDTYGELPVILATADCRKADPGRTARDLLTDERTTSMFKLYCAPVQKAVSAEGTQIP